MFETGTKEEVFLRIGNEGGWTHVRNVRGYPDHADDIAQARNLCDDGAVDELHVMGYRANQYGIVDIMFRPGTGQCFQAEQATCPCCYVDLTEDLWENGFIDTCPHCGCYNPDGLDI